MKPKLTDAELKARKAERNKRWYEENKLAIAEWKKRWREENKLAIAEQNKRYREENKLEVRERERKYAKKMCAMLSDVYIINGLLKMKRTECTPDLIELKRQQIELRRLTLELTKTLKEHENDQ